MAVVDMTSFLPSTERDRAHPLSGSNFSFVSLGGFPSWTTARSASHSTGDRAANPTSRPRRKVWHPRRHVSLIEYDFPQSRVGRVTGPVKPKRYGTVTRPEPSEHSSTRGGNRYCSVLCPPKAAV